MRGYTLIEVLVATSILVFAFGFGLASYRDFSRRQVNLSARRQIEGDLRVAQQSVFSGTKPAGCSTLNGYRFTPAAMAYSVVAVCDTPATEYSVGKDAIPLPGGVELSTTPANTSILFNVLGRGTDVAIGASWTATLTQSATGNIQTIIVNSAGEIK